MTGIVDVGVRLSVLFRAIAGVMPSRVTDVTHSEARRLLTRLLQSVRVVGRP